MLLHRTCVATTPTEAAYRPTSTAVAASVHGKQPRRRHGALGATLLKRAREGAPVSAAARHSVPSTMSSVSTVAVTPPVVRPQSLMDEIVVPAVPVHCYGRCLVRPLSRWCSFTRSSP